MKCGKCGRKGHQANNSKFHRQSKRSKSRNAFTDFDRGQLDTLHDWANDFSVTLRDNGIITEQDLDDLIGILRVEFEARRKNQKKNEEPYPSSYKVRQAKKLVKIKKVTEEGNFISVRLRDPSQFKLIKTPAWATKVAESVTKGSKVRMGQTPKGNWLIQTILIPKQRGKVKARSMGRKIQRKIEGK